MLGIDLGTTFCAVATLDDRGRPTTLPNRDGDILTPSAVYVSADTLVVGQPALDVQQEFPGDVATLVKRRMGYPDLGRTVNGRQFRPETISAVILKKLVNDAATRVGKSTDVVITVPAYFDDARRKATQDAGRIAGLNVIDIVDEPGAAALTYALAGGHMESTDRNVLVYDLGGGTFDVTVVRLARKRFQTVAIEGDVRLGGHDWDTRIVDHVAQLFMKQHDADPRQDDKARALLYASAERAKRTLSKLPKTTVTVAHAGKTLVVPISRTDFERLTLDLLTRTRLTVQQVLRHAKLDWSNIDELLLVGGSTHMPMTRRMLKELSGKEPTGELAVSELVARGAAIHAGIRAARAKPKANDDLGDIVEVQVNAHSLGVEVRSGSRRINDVLIVKNTQLPAGGTRMYRTVRAGQKHVRVKVLQGEAHQAEACVPVGECWIRDLPPELPARAPIEVTCGCAANGLIEVTAKDTTTGRSVRADLRRASGLSDAEIAAEKRWLDSMTVL